ncbi:hypothetical protein Tco_0241009 [Tanacetum coccineum]
MKHCPLVFRNRRGDEARIKKTCGVGFKILRLVVIDVIGRDVVVSLSLFNLSVSSHFYIFVTLDSNSVSRPDQLGKYRVDSVWVYDRSVPTEANNLPRSEFIVTLLHEINEIVFIVKLLSLSWSLSCCRLVPLCFVIFDLEPLSLSFDFVFMSEIFKSLSFSLDRLCHLVILCLDRHTHTLHHLESLLTISLDRLDILKEDLFEHEHVVQFRRTSLTGFPTQSVRSSNAYALDSPYLLVLNIGTSQSRQHDMSESDSYYLSD